MEHLDKVDGSWFRNEEGYSILLTFESDDKVCLDLYPPDIAKDYSNLIVTFVAEPSPPVRERGIILEDGLHPDNPQEREEMEYCLKKTDETTKKWGVVSDADDRGDDDMGQEEEIKRIDNGGEAWDEDDEVVDSRRQA